MYAADITYGTNNEFGFDYLRDNMANLQKMQWFKRDHAFAIVDEVDSILIDEARTPLIISGQGEKSSQLTRLLTALPLSFPACASRKWMPKRSRTTSMPITSSMKGQDRDADPARSEARRGLL